MNFWKQTKYTALALLIGSSAIAQDVDLDMVVATVDGEKVMLGDVLALKDSLPPEYLEGDNAAILPQLVDQLAVQMLLAENVKEDEALEFRLEAAERGVKVDAVVKDYIDADLTDEYLHAKYDELIGDAPTEYEYNASHILIPTEEEAKAAIERINGGESFADVAKELSSDGSSENGGSLGWFGAGQMVPEFETAAAALEVGDISEPVQSQFGWHVIILDDKREAEKPSFEEVESQLRTYAQQLLIEERINEAKEEADISIVEGLDPAVLDNEL